MSLFPLIYAAYLEYRFGCKIILMVYDKDEAMRVLQEELNWYYYCGKHYEVTFTKYFQGIVLTQKFNIDKRKLHLSELILCK